ncbi:hypothetical protein M513_11845 [Trichuris suis]|uniref:SH2 domain-containing protein n=1 Tax=Trichuris suis TaxID=68888 RepID=A0A085LQJ9_9BILA|nr:hypothetical protein M513_11845 [Trichuris suis]
MDLFGSLSTGDTYGGDSETDEPQTASLQSLMSTSSSDLSTASTEGTNELIVLETPQRPISELSFYHGLGSRNALRARLIKAGDFLLFCDVEHDCKPSLLVLNYNCCFAGVFVFEQDEQGKFFIQQAKQPNASFPTIGEAVRNYKHSGTMLQVQTSGSFDLYILVREVVNPQYEQMHSYGAKGIHWTYLPFYHGHLPHDQLSSRLERNGDFLLLSANDQHLLRLCVRWNGTVKILKTKLQPNSGHYCLPRTNKLQPIEIVSSVEEYVKAVVAGRCVLDNCILKRFQPRSLHASIRLLKPVENDDILRNERVVQSCHPEVLPYFFTLEQPGACKYMFEREGDFMLIQRTEDSSLCLCVLAKGQVKVVDLSSVERNGHYLLPRGHTAEPVEWVDSLDEFIKSSIVHGMPIFGLLPGRPVLRDSKLQRVRRSTFKTRN